MTIYLRTALWIPLLGLVFISCQKTAGEAETTNQLTPAVAKSLNQISLEAFKAEGLQWVQCEITNIPRIVRASGVVDVPPESRYQLSTLASGYINEISLIPGDKVQKNQILLKLINPDYLQLQQRYLDSKINFELADLEWARQQNLFKEQVVSERSFEEAKARYTQTKSSYESLKKQLSLLGFKLEQINEGILSESLDIRSPSDGVVTKIYLTNGQFTEASSPMMEIIQTDHIHLELDVFEGEASIVKEGQSLEFKLSGQKFDTHGWMKGELFRMNASLNTENRTLSVHGHVESWDNPLIGAFVEARIFTGSESLMTIPKSAVWTGPKGPELRYLVEELGSMYEWKAVPIETQTIMDAPNEETHVAFRFLSEVEGDKQFLSRK